MFETTVESLATGAGGKVGFLKSNPVGYFVASMLAGVFVAFGGFVAMAVAGYGGALLGSAAKIAAAVAFASALSLVIMAGSELFTGNNLVVGLGALRKRCSWRDCITLWVFCWIGNLVGSWLAVLLFHYAGADTPELVAKSFAATAATKCGYGIGQLVLRGILCNILVCLAVWCAAKMKDETAKLVMVIWCILVFMVCGFEHSIANMSIIGVALLNPAAKGVTLFAYANNLAWVTLGNAVGGFVFVALPYALMARKEGK